MAYYWAPEFGDSPISVPAGASLVSYLNTYSGTGQRLMLAPDTTYDLDMTQLTVSPTNFVIEGAGPGAIDTGGSDVLTTGTIIDITGVNAANTHAWAHIVFKDLKIIAPTPAANQGIWSGSSNLDFKFYNVVFADVAPCLFLNSGPVQEFYSCHDIQSSTPPAAMNPCIAAPGGRVVVENCVVDYNPSLASSISGGRMNLFLGAAGYGSNSPVGPWYVRNNQFLPSANGWTCDSIIDLETLSTTFTDLWFEDNYLHNARIWAIQGETAHINRNRTLWDTTPALSGTSIFAVQTSNGNATTGWTLFEYEGNQVVDNIGSETTTNPALGDFAFDAPVRSLYIKKNTFIYDSRHVGGGPNAVLTVKCTATNTANPSMGLVEVMENNFGCVNASGTLLAAINVFAATAAGAFDRVRVLGNKGLNAFVATNAGPATVAAGYTSCLLVGSTGVTTTVNELDAEGNNLGAGVSSGDVWYAKAGTVTYTQRNWKNNWPREVAGTFASNTAGATYEHGNNTIVGPSVAASGPSTLFVRLTAAMALTTLTVNGTSVLGGTTATIETITIPLCMGDVVVWGTATSGPANWIVPSVSTE